MAPKSNSSIFISSIRSSNRRQQKRCKKRIEDRISSLPDSVVCHILSFLPTKFAVGTSMLSRRWRYTWTCVANLDFHDMLLLSDLDSILRRLHFTRFVNRVLVLRTDPIRKFRLKVSNLNSDTIAEEINSWVCSAIMRNVEELDLRIIPFVFHLPNLLFSCETIKILKLHSNVSLKKIPDSVCLPSLKVLHLKSLLWMSHVNIQKILGGSPVLEELLIVINCHPSNDVWRTLHVKSSSLKSLIIDKIKRYLKGHSKCYAVVVDAPKLEFLELKDHVSEEFDIKNVSSPVKATIDVSQYNGHAKPPNEYGNQVFDLVKQMSNVKSLSLSVQTIEALFDASNENFPQFNNLTKLDVGVSGIGLLMLTVMIRYSPNLKEIICIKDKGDSSSDTIPYDNEAMFEGQSAPKCLLTSLERLEFVGFEGNGAEMKMVEYFLKTAKALKQIKISYSAAVSRKELDILKKLTMFPRASSACQLLFA